MTDALTNNPIYIEIQRLSPGYRVSEVKRKEISRNTNPQLTAERLDGRVTVFRDSFARQYPGVFDPSIISIAVVLDSIDLSKSFRGSPVGLESLLQRMGTDAAVAACHEAGRRAGLREGRALMLDEIHEMEFVEALYHLLFKRAPDGAGLAHNRDLFYNGHLRPSELVFGLEESAEFQRMISDFAHNAGLPEKN